MGREILDEAYHHFALEGRQYEYGRGDGSMQGCNLPDYLQWLQSTESC